MPVPAWTMRIEPGSLAMYKLPEASSASPQGLISALVAGPPSPLKPVSPLPATVVMMPVLVVTFRTRPPDSAI